MPRVLPEPTEHQRDLLRAVERAADDRREADKAYAKAITDAADAGLTSTQIAPATGTTYQAIQKILARYGQ